MSPIRKKKSNGKIVKTEFEINFSNMTSPLKEILISLYFVILWDQSDLKISFENLKQGKYVAANKVVSFT